jgi:hypothetical protein
LVVVERHLVPKWTDPPSQAFSHDEASKPAFRQVALNDGEPAKQGVGKDNQFIERIAGHSGDAENGVDAGCPARSAGLITYGVGGNPWGGGHRTGLKVGSEFSQSLAAARGIKVRFAALRAFSLPAAISP